MISPETIALVRERTNIVAVITESVPSLKRRGRSFVGLCPFHKEKTPSFHVNPDRGFFHCFGCKESGSAIDFLMKHEGHTFPEAVRALAERCGIAVAGGSEARHDRGRSREEAQRRSARGHRRRGDVLRAPAPRARKTTQYAIEELAKRGLEPDQRRAPAVSHRLRACRVGLARAVPQGAGRLARARRAGGLARPALEAAAVTTIASVIA